MLKITFIFNFALCGVAVAAADDGKPAASLERLAAVVDYLAADYPGAVAGGKVIAPSEYEEQRGLAADASALAAEVPAATSREELVAAAAAVRAAVERRAPADEVAAACRAVRTLLVERLGLALSPAAPPSLERGRALYPQACASCHGADGRAETVQAKALKPPPTSFFDEQRMARVSPQLAFHAITFGTKETAMASFDTLPAADRWSLAFHVIALRHQGRDAGGGELLARAGDPIAKTPSRLAALSDDELDQFLTPALPAPADRARAIAWLRVEAPYAASPGGAFAEARRLASEMAAAGSIAERHQLAVAAYLDGVEPHEASLRARDPDLAARIESEFLDLRRAIDGGAGRGELEARAGRIALLLDRAEERTRGRVEQRSVAFVAALTIALREGLEAALLIAALLAFLRKSGREESARLVHWGWLAAVPAGLATWFVAGALVSGARRELVEAVVTLLAAAMILAVSHWVLGRKEARHWVGFLQRKVMALAPGQRAWPLFALAFLAAYREAFEVVLFYRALLLDVPGQGAAVIAGAAAGAVGIVLTVLIVGRLGRRLNPRPVMLASSVLLAALSVALVGRGVRALQEGGYLALTPVALPDLSSVGLYPTLQGLCAQAATVAALFVPSLWSRLKRVKAVQAPGS